MDKPFIKIGFLGIVVLIIGITLNFIFPDKLSKSVSKFKTPIIAFEFAETPEDIYDIFQVVESKITEKQYVKSMNTGNYIDFVYLLVYSVFLFLFSLKIAKITKSKYYYIVAIFAVLAFIGDIFENLQLLSITSKLESGNFIENLQYLKIFTWLKWTSLALVFWLLFVYFIDSKSFFKYASFLSLIPFILCVISYFKHSIIEFFVLSIAVMFIFLIIFSFAYKIKLANNERVTIFKHK